MSITQIIFLMLLPLAQVAAQALPTHYAQTNWTTENGLPQNTISAIWQTRAGYLWLGTLGGLARFDGVKFTVFNATNTPGLRSNRISFLYEDRAGALWVGTDSGGLTRFQAGVFTAYTTAQGLSNNTVYVITEDRQGDLWIGTDDGLSRFSHGQFKNYGVADGLPDKAVHALAEDREGHLWVATSGGLAQFRAGVFAVEAVQQQAGKNAVPPIQSLCVRRNGSLWAAAGQYVAQILNGKFEPPTLLDCGGNVRQLYEDAAGMLWVNGFGGVGLRQVSGGQCRPHPQQQSLPPFTVWGFHGDREGNFWIGTNGGGLFRWRRNRVVTYTTDDGLLSNSLLPIVEDGAGALWLGTLGRGVMRWQAGRITPFTRQEGLPGDSARALLIDRAGDLWIGLENTVVRLKPGPKDGIKDGQLTSYTAAQGLPPGNVWALYQDRAGEIWIGSANGLSRLHNETITTYRTTDGLVNNSVRFITEDGAGALWLGTVEGLSRFQAGRFTNYTTAQGLSHNFVRAIHIDRDGSLWIGTYGGGLNRFRNGKFVAITTKDGLFDDNVSRIIADEHDNFWMSGNRGIYRVSRQELNDYAAGKLSAFTCVSYRAADGMKSSETNGGGQPAGWRARDGRLWFPTIAGVAVIDPREINALPPPVEIEQTILDRSPVKALEKIEVGPQHRDLEIHYTGLSLGLPEHVQFKYQLEGYDRDWVQAGERRVAYYASLPPGQYTFRVTAANADGVWNSAGRRLLIEVIPPFWRRWWFVSLMLVGVASLVWSAHRWRLALVEKKHAQQQVFSQQLLESQERERQRIAAELHDSLGQRLIVIKNLALLLLQNKFSPTQTQAQIGDISAEASRAIHEVKEISYNLRPHQLEQAGLTKTLHGLVKQVAHASGIAITAELDPLDGVFAPADEINVYRIVQEGLSNIVKHSGATAAQLVMLRKDAHVELTLQDNGRGMADWGLQIADSQMPFNPHSVIRNAQSKGFGLTGIAERVRMLGGTFALESTPGAGTRLQINLALKHEPSA
ncbi:MAG: hypothetical protein HYR56_20810 [Acidobacteria bacterium]|nr:hypothetical protein [Acidobacteriota bacterium]MBI3425101.1 hypothetical protein [Acidobacteriota bacterium]